MTCTQNCNQGRACDCTSYLVHQLRNWDAGWNGSVEMCNRAADEIERLTAEIALYKEVVKNAASIAADYEKLQAAARNLIAVKGRYHTELAYKRLEEVLK